MDIDVKNLHPLEVRLLRHVKVGEPITAERIVSELGYNVGQCNQAFSWLCAKNYLVEKSRTTHTLYEITDLGKKDEQDGLPAQRIYNYLKEQGAHTLPEIAEALGLEKSEVGSAFGQLSKGKIARMDELHRAFVEKQEMLREVLIAGKLLSRALKAPLDDATLSDEEKRVITTISKKRYFFSPEGVLQYGWIRVNGKVYFGKNQTGQLAQNEWINLSDYSGRYNGYFFKSDASMAVNQWVSYRWVGSNGQYTGVTNKVGLVDEQNGTYFYNNSHRRVYNSFASAGGKRYYVNGAGQVVKNTWFSVGGRSYYAQEDGSLLVKKWKGKKYLGADGAMAVGWTKIGKYTCYFNSNGDAASGWMKINGEYY